MKPKALFLDDERWRHASFDKRHRDSHDVFHAYTIKQFTKLVAEHTFELISLDHDLADPEFFVSPGGVTLARAAEETGMDAVEALGVLVAPGSAAVIVHSWNVPAANRMMARLRELGFSPIRQMFEAERSTLSMLAEMEKEAAHGCGREGGG